MAGREPVTSPSRWRTIVRLLTVGAIVAVVAAQAQPRPAETPTFGRLLPGTTIEFSLLLEFDDRGLRRHVSTLDDPRSPRPRRSLRPSEIGRRFGVSAASLADLQRELNASGIRVVRIYPQRTAVRARGPLHAVERLFRVALREHFTVDGVRYRAPVATPTIPRSLRRVVAGVLGLDTEPRQRPAAHLPSGVALGPIDAATAYGILPLRDLGIDGSGVTIAIGSFSTFPRSGTDDLKAFDGEFEISGPAPRTEEVAGGTADVHLELSLDIDVIRAVAPKAQIVVYEAPNSDDGVLAIFQEIAASKNGITIVSYSWGRCDSGLEAKYREAIERELRIIAAERGINVFVASGDAGAYDCQRTDFANHDLAVNFPADSPSVISVGGTLLSTRSDGSYLREVAWEDPLSNGGGGGGINPVAEEPSWQKEYAPLPEREGRRGVPDVSAAASPASPWWVYDSGGWLAVGGTSAAAPFWAASLALIEQYAAKKGIRRPLCFVAPLLYEIAASNERRRAFRDVTRGGNRHYDAGPGWDFATGLGSPHVYNLAQALVELLERDATRSCADRLKD